MSTRVASKTARGPVDDAGPKKIHGDPGRARGVDRLLDILNYFANVREPVSALEIANKLTAPKSSVYEILDMLMSRGYVERISSGKFVVGRSAYALGSAFGRQTGLCRIVQPALRRLSNLTGEISEFCVFHQWQQLVVFAESGRRNSYFHSQQGILYPMPMCASGRFLLQSFGPEDIIRNIPPQHYKMANGAVLSPSGFLQASKRAIARGYEVVNGAIDPNISCVAVPVYNAQRKCIAATALVVPLQEFAAREQELVTHLRQATTPLAEAIELAGLASEETGPPV
jgi:DNA-binding IclR family transcriptional regulator